MGTVTTVVGMYVLNARHTAWGNAVRHILCRVHTYGHSMNILPDTRIWIIL